MMSKCFIAALLHNGFRQMDTEFSGVSLFQQDINGTKYAVAVLNCMADCQYSAMQLNSIERTLEITDGIQQMLFVAFTYDPYNTRVALNGNYRHWIYDEKEKQLQIFDDQPGNFLNLRVIIENLSQPQNGALQYIFTINNLMVLINVVVFIVMEIMGDTENWKFLISHGAIYTQSIFKKHEYYRIFTAMFMHSGLSHIFNNMLVLLFVGDNLERAVGKLKYVIIYLGSGIIGNVVSLIYYFIINQPTCSVGASGAIFGVIGAMVYILIVNKGRLEDLTLTRVLIFVALSIYLGLRSTGVSLSAHMGGLVGGFLLAIVLYGKRGCYK